MSIDVDRLSSEIDVDPSKAIAGLNAFDAALTAASRDRHSDIDLDIGSSMGSLLLFESAADVAVRDRTMNIDVDGAGAAAAAGVLGGVASAAGATAGALGSVVSAGGAAASTMGSLATAAGGAGSGMGSAATGISSSGAAAIGMAGTVVGLVIGLGALALAAIAIGSILPGAFAAAAAGAGILMAAVAPLVGLLGGLPVLIGGLGLVGATLLGGLSGVMAGVTAYKGATEDAGAATEDLKAKQDALRSAQQGLANAIHQVTQAQQGLKDAQEDMAKAPLEAAEAIEDAHFGAAQAALTHKKAILALQQAQKNLTDAQNETARSSIKVTQQTDEFTGKVYDVAVDANDAADGIANQKDALLALQQAQLDVATSKDADSDAQRKLNEMTKKGIKGSDIMVDSRRRLADAQWSLKQAHQGVANAQRAVTRAEEAMAKGAAGATAATKAWDDAQKNLSATGIEFVKFLADDFMPALSDIGKEIQDEMLPGLQGGLEVLMTDFDEIGNELGIVGGLIGDTFEEFMVFWNKPKQRSLLGGMFEGLNESIEAGLGLLRPFSRVLAHITDAAAPVFAGVLEGIGGWLDTIADKWDSKKGKNGLVNFFEDAAYFGGLWWDVLEGAWGVLEPIINAGKPLAAKWLKTMAGDLEDLGDYLSSKKGQKAITQYFEDAVPALKQVWKFITGITDALFNSSKGGTDSGFYKFMKALNDDIVPNLKDFFEDVDGSDLAADLVAIFGAGADFMTALTGSGAIEALNLLGDVLSAIAKGNPAADAYNLDKSDPLNGMSPQEFDTYDDRGYTPDTSSWEKFKDDWDDLMKGPEEGSNFDKFLDDLRASIQSTFSMDNVSDQFESFIFGETLEETGARWSGYFDSIEVWASETWAGIKKDFNETWDDMTKTFREEIAIWRERVNGFNDWLDEFSWSNVWDGLVDGFYTAMEWVAEAWNATLGGLSVDIPGVGKFEIPELNAGDAPSKPYDPAGSIRTPETTALDQQGAGTEQDLPGRGNGRQTIINNTFNEKVDPEHVARALGWQLESVA